MPLFEIDEQVEPRASQLAKASLRYGNHVFEKIVEFHKAGFQDVWHHPEATGKQILEAMGNQATPLLLQSWGLVQYILSVDATALSAEEYTPPDSAHINHVGDGTVTVLYPTDPGHPNYVEPE